MRASDRAELATLRSQLEELTQRCETVAVRYRDTPDSAIASELEATERDLIAAQRALDRARALLRD